MSARLHTTRPVIGKLWLVPGTGERRTTCPPCDGLCVEGRFCPGRITAAAEILNAREPLTDSERADAETEAEGDSTLDDAAHAASARRTSVYDWTAPCLFWLALGFVAGAGLTAASAGAGFWLGLR